MNFIKQQHEMIPREADSSKQESGNAAENFFKVTSKSWSRLKDPRIVRLSKAFGGKDRHSKVCTVRGLRDRRVRLSVPTAIQLYNLQDRLGLDQPSKVVDWLLNVAKHEIDELPPLQIPPGSFQQILASHQAAKRGLKISCSAINMRPSDFEETNGGHNWERNEEERQLNLESYDNLFIAAGNSFPSRENSHLRSAAANQTTEDWHNFGLVPVSGHHHHQQVLVYQQPYFAAQMAAIGTSSGAHSVQPIHFMNMSASVLPSQGRNENEQSSQDNI